MTQRYIPGTKNPILQTHTDNERKRWWKRLRGLNCGERYVLLALLAVVDEYDWCYASEKHLAALTGLSVRTVRTHLHSLIRYRLLRSHKKNRHSVTEYYVWVEHTNVVNSQNDF